MRSIMTRCSRRRAGGLLLAVVLLALPLAARAGDDHEGFARADRFKQANARYLKGVKLWQDGKPAKARQEAMACLKMYSDFADAYLLLARLNYHEGKLEPALQEIEAAFVHFAQFGQFYLQQWQEGQNLLRDQRQRKEEYIRSLTESLANAAMTDAEKARIESQIRMDSQELTEIDRKLREPLPSALEPPAEYHFVRGTVLFKLRRPGEARDAFLAAVTADPRHANAWNNLISIHFAANDLAGAAKYVQQAEANGVALNEKLKQAILDRQGK